MEKSFKIFYSWQSDLTGNRTRYVIEEAINETAAFLRDTITVIPDRDTKGKTGSPNIEETIFKKIDDCDLFIADVSIVSSHPASLNPFVRSIINSDNAAFDVSQSDVCYRIKPHKLFLFNKETEARIRYEVK